MKKEPRSPRRSLWRPGIHRALALLLLSATIPAFAGTAAERPCIRGPEPAATLLFPYFEVDLSDPNGQTTLIALTNPTAEALLANVTVWSDWALPVFSFEVYLTGFDVETFNLRDTLQGHFPATGSAASPQGNRSGSNVGFPGCIAEDVTDPKIDVGFVQAALTGEPLDGLCWSSPPLAPEIARGYLTADVVRACSALFPSDDGYFANDDSGVATDENRLVGDYFLVDPGKNFAQGETAVHILADRELTPPGGASFYGEYSGGADHRLPLSSRHGIRFLRGGVLDGGTQILVWKDVAEPPSGPLPCKRSGGFRLFNPGWTVHFEEKILFDEEENAVRLDDPISDSPTFVLATQKVPLEEIFPADTGWLDLELGDQSWVGAILSAQERFSVGFSAWRLNDLCQPAVGQP